MQHSRQPLGVWLGLASAVASLVLLTLVIPSQTVSGLFESARGRLVLGDGLMPTIAAVIMFLASLAVIAESRRNASTKSGAADHLKFAALVAGVFAITLCLVRWSGPLLIGGLHQAGALDATYRALRASPPWNYTGYLLGGTFMIASMVFLIDRRLSARTILIAFLATLVIAMFYDLPFKTLLLPPNGDI